MWNLHLSLFTVVGKYVVMQAYFQIVVGNCESYLKKIIYQGFSNITTEVSYLKNIYLPITMDQYKVYEIHGNMAISSAHLHSHNQSSILDTLYLIQFFYELLLNYYHMH